jgi:hypothetical protein
LSEYSSATTGSCGQKIKVWKISLHDLDEDDREVDCWYSVGKPWTLGPQVCQFNERGTNIAVTVSGNFRVQRVEIDA